MPPDPAVIVLEIAGLVDETYVKVGGRWRYVYRAIDHFGQVIDVYVSPRRDATAAPVLCAGHRHNEGGACRGRY
jgi:transposase-like protein